MAVRHSDGGRAPDEDHTREGEGSSTWIGICPIDTALGSFVAPMSSRGDGVSRMFETCLDRRMRLYRDRLDIAHTTRLRGIRSRAIQRGFDAPLPCFLREQHQSARF